MLSDKNYYSSNTPKAQTPLQLKHHYSSSTTVLTQLQLKHYCNSSTNQFFYGFHYIPGCDHKSITVHVKTNTAFGYKWIFYLLFVVFPEALYLSRTVQRRMIGVMSNKIGRIREKAADASSRYFSAFVWRLEEIHKNSVTIGCVPANSLTRHFPNSVESLTAN